MPHKAHSVNGEYYPSVTEILNGKPKPWLDAWKAKWGVWADRKVKAATDIGTDFHKSIEDVNYIVKTLRTARMSENFWQWAANKGLKVKASELHVVSEMYQYHGTFDAVGYLKDKPKTLCLFDWKTSSGIYPDMGLQLAAYAQAYKEQTGIEIKRGIIVHVSKDKPHHKVTVKEYTLGKRLFKKFVKRKMEFDAMKEAGNNEC